LWSSAEKEEVRRFQGDTEKEVRRLRKRNVVGTPHGQAQKKKLRNRKSPTNNEMKMAFEKSRSPSWSLIKKWPLIVPLSTS
jgi:hypothetical protein